MPTTEDRLLSPQEVADWLSVPLATVYAWRSRREGPAGFRIGRHVRYRRDDVEAWLEERAQQEAADDEAA